jgi:predicted dinucleotide-binding enzyme
MKIAVLGTGMVGKAIATRLVELGHVVAMGSRTADNESALEWARAHGDAEVGTFADVVADADFVFNCTKGSATIEAIEMAGADNVAGKVLVDVANPLDFSTGELRLLTEDDDSLGEQLQRALPNTMVVKALNTMNCNVMVHPERIAGDHVVFICGNDEDAKAATSALLGEFGWSSERIIDLGDISAARGTEMYLPLWLRIYQSTGKVDFNIGLVGAGSTNG